MAFELRAALEALRTRLEGMPTMMGHRDQPGCTCGRCEPAESVNNPLAMMLTGNHACDFPNCLTVGLQCSWGSGYCGPAIRAAVGDYADTGQRQ